MRRKKKNPGPAVLVLVGGGLAAAIAAGVAIFRRKTPPVLVGTTGTSFATQPAFTTGLPSAEGILVGDCVVAVQGQAGFTVPGDVPKGENTFLKVTSSPGAGGTAVQAISIDPRVTPAGAAFVVPTQAISGAGECVG